MASRGGLRLQDRRWAGTGSGLARRLCGQDGVRSADRVGRAAWRRRRRRHALIGLGVVWAAGAPSAATLRRSQRSLHGGGVRVRRRRPVRVRWRSPSSGPLLTTPSSRRPAGSLSVRSCWCGRSPWRRRGRRSPHSAKRWRQRRRGDSAALPRAVGDATYIGAPLLLG